MTAAQGSIHNVVYQLAVKLAKKSVMATMVQRGYDPKDFSPRDIGKSARILVESDPKWIEQAKRRMGR
jgi:hypothetical protein